MSLLGIHLWLQWGASVPEPAAEVWMQALESVEVTHTDEGRSGFQLVFRVGRGQGAQGYALLADPVAAVGSRVVLGLTVSGVPSVLFDGFITHQQFKPSMAPGGSQLTLTGEDVSCQMDREERSEEYPGQSDAAIVETILARYAEFGVVADVAIPEASEQPSEDERSSNQQGTDYAYLQELAARHGFSFFVVPGPVSGQSRAVWGPAMREGAPQAALSINLDAESNVDSIDFSFDGLAAELYRGFVQDRESNQRVDVASTSTARPALGSGDPLAHARIRSYRESAATSAEAFAHAQALTDASTEGTLGATGELDTGRYGRILEARALVDLRGAGLSFDGTWYVKQVTHKVQPGSYKQNFTLSRGEPGAATPSVEV